MFAALHLLGVVHHDVANHGGAFAASPRNPCNAATTWAPSPMAPPTRFTDPERTSPTAKTPGTLDCSGLVALPTSFVQRAPVTTKPALSNPTPQPASHAVAGSAPANRKRLRTSFTAVSPLIRLRQCARSRPVPGSPSRPPTSLLVRSSIFGAASIRSIR